MRFSWGGKNKWQHWSKAAQSQEKSSGELPAWAWWVIITTHDKIVNCAISMELFDVCLDTLCMFGCPIQGYDNVIIFPTLWRRWDALGRLHTTSPLSQGVTARQCCLTEKMHIFSGCFVECTAPRGSDDITSLRKIIIIIRMLALWSGIQGAAYGKKNKHTDVLSGCSYPQIYLTFSGVCTRWSQGYTFTSCFRRLLKFDLMAFFFFLKTCKTQGLFRPHVYMIVFFQMRLLSYCWRWTIDLSRRGDLYFNDQLLLFRLNYWSVFYCIMCSF